MNQQLFELALKKQRLQFRSAEQRRQLTLDAAALLPAFGVAEYLRTSLRWLREHPAIVAASLVTIVVARPRTVLRWSRRGWLAWLAWRRWNDATGKDQSLKNPIIERVSALFSK